MLYQCDPIFEPDWYAQPSLHEVPARATSERIARTAGADRASPWRIDDTAPPKTVAAAATLQGRRIAMTTIEQAAYQAGDPLWDDVRGVVLPRAAPYSITWMFFFAQISFSAFGHTVALTSPRCAFLRIDITVRD